MRWCVAMLLTACSTSGPAGTGILAYTEIGTGNIRTLDLASGQSRLIDPGSFVTVSIAADHKYVAYSGMDQVMKVSDLSGNVTPLPPGATGCLDSGRWGAGDSFSFCVACGTEFLPSVTGTARLLSGYGLATSADASLIVYGERSDPCGPYTGFDLVVENIDGSGHHVLAAGLTNAGPIVITPDQQRVVTYAGSGVAVFSIADGTSVDLGTGGLCYMTGPGGERAQFSSDGSHLLICDEPRLVSVDLATGARQTIVEVGAGEGVGPAAFLDDAHITYTHTIDATAPGSDIPQYTRSVHLLSDANDLELITPETSGMDCHAISVSPRGDFVVTYCGALQLFALDGRQLAAQDAVTVLGYTLDTNDLVIGGPGGEARLLSPKGETVQLVFNSAALAFAP